MGGIFEKSESGASEGIGNSASSIRLFALIESSKTKAVTAWKSARVSREEGLLNPPEGRF
jgi:hypothetical protein